jgi:hypothetical protein
MLSVSEQRVGTRAFMVSLLHSMQVAARCQKLSSTSKIAWHDVQWLIKTGATDLVQ